MNNQTMGMSQKMCTLAKVVMLVKFYDSEGREIQRGYEDDKVSLNEQEGNT